MAKIYLQRHTQPKVAPQTCYGISDIPLHKDYNNTHLPKVLEQIKKVKVERIYSSPLQRCHTLACDINKIIHLPDITIDNRLMELNFGEWEMCLWDEIYATEEGRAWFDDFLHTPTLGGESFYEMIERTKKFLDKIEEEDESVIVVTHSGFIRAAMVVTGMIEEQEAFSIEINYGDLIEIVPNNLSPNKL